MNKKYLIFIGLAIIVIIGVIMFGSVNNQQASIKEVNIEGLSPVSTSQDQSVSTVVKPVDYGITARKGWEIRRVFTKATISASGEWSYSCNLWWYNKKGDVWEYIRPCDN